MTDVNSIQVPQINSLPPAPLRSEAGNTFAIKAEAFVAALPAFRVGMIALESVTRQLALIAQEEAAAAANSATAAANSATAAGSAKAAAESAKTAAASSATAAGTAKTAAEAAKTAAAASATAAATSAAAAAASATNAVVNIYVDLLSTAGAAADGSTWALAYTSLLTVLQNLPFDKAVIIYLKEGQTHTLGDPSAQAVIYVPLNCRSLWIRGGTNRPKIKVNHIVHTNGYVYAAVSLQPARIFDFSIAYVNIELVAITGNTSNAVNAQNNNTRFLSTEWGCHLHLFSVYADWVIPTGYAAVSPYVTCASINAQFGYGAFTGGGDVIDNSYLCCHIGLSNAGYTIATNTYWLSVARTNHNIDAPGSGAQLARSFV